MRAARLRQPRGPVVIEEIGPPRPGPGEVLLRMEACGLCRSDLFIQSLESLPRLPLTLGHEGVGVVEETGPGVSELKPGDRAGMTYLYSGCGGCEWCEAGSAELCPRQLNTGYHVDGAFAHYAVARAGYVAHVPRKVDPVQAAPLCCAGWTAYRAVQEAGLEAGQWLAVFGAGGLGHLAIQFARLEGLNVAAVDVADEKLDLARRAGAQLAVNAAREKPGRSLRANTGGAHAAIAFVGSAPVIRQAFGSLRRRGTLVLVGLETEDFALPVVDTVLKQIRIRGSFLGKQSELDKIFRLLAEGKLRLEAEPCGLDDLPEAMEQMRAGKLRGRRVVKFV